MKKFLILTFTFVLIFSALVGCDTKQNLSPIIPEGEKPVPETTAKESEFYDIVVETQELLDIVADDIYSNWYDCIYNDRFLESIDYAIACALSDNAENVNTIKANNETIKTLYSEIKDGELKSEVKEVIHAYNDYYAFVIEVSGSFKSFSENKEAFKKELASALKNLEFEL